MNANCCYGASDKWKDVLECDVKEDDQGILVSIRPKDPKNTDPLKDFFRSSQKLFGTCGCC